MAKPSPLSSPPEKVNQVGLGKVLGLDASSIRRLTQEQIFRRETDGTYPLTEAVRAYVAYRESLTAEKAEVGNADDRIRSLREEKLQRELDQQDRNLIELSEALDRFDEITGAFLAALSGLPARITRNQDERKRIESITDTVRAGLASRFREKRDHLRSGSEPDGTAAETDE